jgi:hypothetical protein
VKTTSTVSRASSSALLAAARSGTRGGNGSPGGREPTRDDIALLMIRRSAD